jgi:hypothetical protein
MYKICLENRLFSQCPTPLLPVFPKIENQNQNQNCFIIKKYPLFDFVFIHFNSKTHLDKANKENLKVVLLLLKLEKNIFILLRKQLIYG